MTDCLNEQLSALLDGELPPTEAELLLRRLERDGTLRATLARYTLAGDALRVGTLEAGRAPEVAASAGFAARISAAVLADEQRQATVRATQAAPARPAASVAAQARRTRLRWLRPLGGMAVAATVAGVAVMVLQRDPGPASAPVTVAAVSPAPVASAPLAVAPAISGPRVAASDMLPALTALPSADEPLSYTTPLTGSSGAVSPSFIPPAELASYVVAHSEVSGPFARRNVLTGLVTAPEAVPAPAPAATAEAPQRRAGVAGPR